jgi:hypothetical protein
MAGLSNQISFLGVSYLGSFVELQDMLVEIHDDEFVAQAVNDGT